MDILRASLRGTEFFSLNHILGAIVSQSIPCKACLLNCSLVYLPKPFETVHDWPCYSGSASVCSRVGCAPCATSANSVGKWSSFHHSSCSWETVPESSNSVERLSPASPAIVCSLESSDYVHRLLPRVRRLCTPRLLPRLEGVRRARFRRIA
jgi:hypothetical protein